MIRHWIETYPHDVYASVLLLEDKIYNFKIGQRYWESPLDMTWKFPLPEDFNKLKVNHKCWRVETPEEHDKVFTEYAKEWFEQWKLHEDYDGFNPY